MLIVALVVRGLGPAPMPSQSAVTGPSASPSATSPTAPSASPSAAASSSPTCADDLTVAVALGDTDGNAAPYGLAVADARSEPSAAEFNLTGSMTVGRIGPTVNALKTATVLVTGGMTVPGNGASA